jgi:hypothetical protein
MPRFSCNHRRAAAVQLQRRRDERLKRRRASIAIQESIIAARHMSLWHVKRRTSYLGSRSIAFHWQSRRRKANPQSSDQHTRSRRTTSPRSPVQSRITTNASDTPRIWSHQVWRQMSRPSYWSKRPVNTCCHQLWDAVLKIVADVKIELMQIYSSKLHSHHPNDVSKELKPNPTY